jgi:predicted AlkP superfamily phosphohydrolase/phosphomutase
VRKTLIIGVDGASPDLINNWIDTGKLLNFKKIKDKGVFGNLESTNPPLTPCAWSSFITGKNPAKHGIYDFFYLDPEYNIRLNSSKRRKSKDLWEYLSESGFKSIVFNVPFTYPPKKIKGIMVTDFTTPSVEVDFTYPLDIKFEILKKYPNFRFAEESKYSKRLIDRRKFASEGLELADLRFELSTDLMKNDRFDFSIIVYMVTDHAQHWYWKFMDKTHPEYLKNNQFKEVILKAYEKIDSFLGKYLDMFPDHNIIIISDHGGGPYYKDVSVNKFLMDKGYLFFKKKRSVSKIVINKIGVNRILSLGLNMGFWKFVNKLPKIKKLLLTRFMPTYKDIDWNKTVAYSYGYYGPIYFNRSKILEGKEGLEEEIIKNLKELKDPYSKKPIVKNIWKKSELYSGDYIDTLPDIILNMGDFAYGSSSTFPISSINVLSNPKTFKSGDHSINGVFMAIGPDINEGKVIEDSKIYDIAPTILHIFDIPIPQEMDGRVLKDIFKRESTHAKKKVKHTKIDSNEKARIKSAIKNLKF